MGKLGRRATILDVAREAEVSVGSVSNVLNGTRPVSALLRDQVLAAAAKLDFRINGVAQTLRRRRSGVIGFCTTYLTTVYLRELADELDGIATRNGYDLIQVFTQQEPELELRRIRSLLARQVDGLILLPSLDPKQAMDAIAAAGAPVVVVDRLPDTAVDYVIVNNKDAMQDVVRVLRANGHRRLLFIAQNLQVITTRHRLEGLTDAAQEDGGGFRYDIIERGADPTAFRTRVLNILGSPDAPTAIVTGNSSVALWTVRTLQEAGLRWPDDVTLVTFDEPEWASILVPPLATIRSPTSEIADHVWSALISQIEGTRTLPATVAVRAELIARGSIGPSRR